MGWFEKLIGEEPKNDAEHVAELVHDVLHREKDYGDRKSVQVGVYTVQNFFNDSGEFDGSDIDGDGVVDLTEHYEIVYFVYDDKSRPVFCGGMNNLSLHTARLTFRGKLLSRDSQVLADVRNALEARLKA